MTATTTATNIAGIPTWEDLRTAGLILACKGHTCKVTGLPLFSAEFVTWAKEVCRAFARSAWRLVKRTGIALKAAWQQLRHAGRSELVVVVPFGVSGRALKSGRAAQAADPVHASMTMRSKAGAFGLAAKRRRIADALQSAWKAFVLAGCIALACATSAEAQAPVVQAPVVQAPVVQCEGTTKAGARCRNKVANGQRCHLHGGESSAKQAPASVQCEGTTKAGARCRNKVANGQRCHLHK